MSEKFHATDDDLPEELFSDKPLKRQAERPRDAEIAAQVFFPVIKKPAALTAKQERDLKRDREESEHLEEKKIFVKVGKKSQMYTWLYVMSKNNLFSAMEPREQDFCLKLLTKFQKYSVQGVKWITLKQYQWLKRIAGKYIPMIGVVNDAPRATN